MTTIFCHHPAVIFRKDCADQVCPDCGRLVPYEPFRPSVPAYVNEERLGSLGDEASDRSAA